MLCSCDGKGAVCEARHRGFKSQPNNILRDFGRAFGTAFGVLVQETGAYGIFSSSGCSDVFRIVP